MKIQFVSCCLYKIQTKEKFKICYVFCLFYDCLFDSIVTILNEKTNKQNTANDLRQMIIEYVSQLSDDNLKLYKENPKSELKIKLSNEFDSLGSNAKCNTLFSC